MSGGPRRSRQVREAHHTFSILPPGEGPRNPPPLSRDRRCKAKNAACSRSAWPVATNAASTRFFVRWGEIIAPHSKVVCSELHRSA